MAKVLIVEDERGLRLSLELFLKDAGHAVHDAPDAASALAALESDRYDVVLTDIIMPRTDGIMLLETIAERWPSIEVILMTGEPTIETTTAAFKAGAYDYLTKPISRDTLLRAVEKAAEVKRLNEEKRALERENLQYREHLEQLVEQRTQALRESEAKFRLIIEHSPDAIFLTDENGDYQYVNDAACALLGYSRQELLGLNIGDISRPADRAANLEGFQTLLEEGALFTEVELVKKDGTTLSAELSAVVLPNGTIYGSCRDITARQRAMKELADNYTLLRIAGETARFGGWSVDLHTNICYWSDTVADIHGTPHGYAPTVDEGIKFYAPEWRETIQTLFTLCAEEGVPYDEEMEILTRTGRRVWVRTVGVPVRDEDGAIVEARGAFQDITARKAAEARVDHLNSLLLAIRNVNQSIVQASDLKEVLENASKALVETRGYLNCVIGIRDRERNKIEPLAEHGSFPLKTKWSLTPAGEGTGPMCLKTALRSGQITLMHNSSDCERCIYRLATETCHSVTAPIRLDGKNIGLIHVIVDRDLVLDENEKELIREAAGDLAFAQEKFQADEALREAYEFSTNLVHTAPAIILTLSPTGKIVDFNPYLEQLTGYSLEEVRGKDWFSIFIPPEDREEIRNLFRCAIGNTRTEGNINPILTKSGEKIQVEWYDRTLEDADGKVVGLLSAGQDVTERVEAVAAVKESEAEKSYLLDSMMNAFAIFESVFDDEGEFVSYRFQYINSAFETITGVRSDEVEGKTVHEVWPGTEESWVQKYGQVAVTGEPEEFDMYHEPTTKLYHCIVCRPWRTEERFCVIFEDITERRRAKKVLEEQLDELRRWQNVILDREDRVLELKREVDELRARLGEEARYALHRDETRDDEGGE